MFFHQWGFEVSNFQNLSRFGLGRAAALLALLSGSSAIAQDLPAVPEVTPAALAMPAPEMESVPAPVDQGIGFHSGWAFLSETGSLDGTAWTMTSSGPAPVSGATVAVMVGGEVIASAVSDADGKYSIPGLRDGIFTVKTTAANACSAFTARFVPNSLAGSLTGMDVYCASMAPTELESIIGSMWVPGTPAAMYANQSAEIDYPGAQTYVVKRVNGVIQGQLTFATANIGPLGHVVRLYQDGKLIEEAASDALAQFEFKSDVVGPVDIVVGGPGYAAVGAMVVESGVELTEAKPRGDRFVSKIAKPAALQSSTLYVPVVSQFPAAPAEPVVIDEGVPLPLGGAPMPGFAGGGGGFAGGGGGFGGGGGGGIGGAAGLAGLAGLAIGITALADDDDGFNLNQASPLN